MVSAELTGSVLRQYRKAKGVSQEVFSGLAGLNRTHYSKLERGLRSPTISTLIKIADALDIPPHKIIQTIEAAAGKINKTDERVPAKQPVPSRSMCVSL